ncbi:MAG: hypothetical protein KGQ60_11170 [Planctomycetes bacterium]|nr:hypothetical protein [Planctomycetota bacterium]
MECITREHRCRTMDELVELAYEWLQGNNDYYECIRNTFAIITQRTADPVELFGCQGRIELLGLHPSCRPEGQIRLESLKRTSKFGLGQRRHWVGRILEEVSMAVNQRISKSSLHEVPSNINHHHRRSVRTKFLCYEDRIDPSSREVTSPCEYFVCA